MRFSLWNVIRPMPPGIDPRSAPIGFRRDKPGIAGQHGL
jgi:hypothetical protein